MDFLDELARNWVPTAGPRQLPWPGDGEPWGFRWFGDFGEWKDYVRSLSLRPGLPLIVTAKFQRAQKLHLAGWFDGDFVKAGELVSLTALELAVKDRYWQQVIQTKPYNKPPKDGGPARPRKASFAELLDHMVTGDGLTDSQLPVVRAHGGSVVRRLRLKDPARPSIADLRNDAAHGFPFDGFPHCGLIEVVRDLIGYAYRAWPGG